MIDKFVVSCALKVTKNTFEGMLMFRARAGGVAAKSGDGVSDIWASAQHWVHEHPHSMLVRFDVDVRRSVVNKRTIAFSVAD